MSFFNTISLPVTLTKEKKVCQEVSQRNVAGECNCKGVAVARACWPQGKRHAKDFRSRYQLQSWKRRRGCGDDVAQH